jgi:hypothetical protein
MSKRNKRNNTRSNGLCTSHPRTIVTSYSNTIERPNSTIKHRIRPIPDPSRIARTSSTNIEKLQTSINT